MTLLAFCETLAATLATSCAMVAPPRSAAHIESSKGLNPVPVEAVETVVGGAIHYDTRVARVGVDVVHKGFRKAFIKALWES